MLLPDLSGKYFMFFRHDISSSYPDNTVVIPKDWCSEYYDLSTEEIISTCNKLMDWYGIHSVNLVANRIRMSKLSRDYWVQNRIFLKQQMTGWCDMYRVEKKVGF